ncbi:hypothetical protein XENORESO_021498, partial [Xenotaenia resolanae]
MSLKTSQKMFLISPHQFKRLTQSDTSIRHTAEENLDADMRAILNEPGLTSYEKIKKYDALLQRYLTLLKQGVNEEQRVSLTLQRDTEVPEHEWSQEKQGPGQDEALKDQ